MYFSLTSIYRADWVNHAQLQHSFFIFRFIQYLSHLSHIIGNKSEFLRPLIKIRRFSCFSSSTSILLIFEIGVTPNDWKILRIFA